MTHFSVDMPIFASRKGAPFLGPRVSALPRVRSADALLRRAVLARLIADPLFHISRIIVAALAGVMTVSGYVTSNGQKDAALSAARRVRGVNAVIDQLVVAAPSPPAPAELIYVLNGPERLLAGRRMTFAALSANRPLAARAQS